MKTFALAMVAAFSLAALGETHSQTYPTRPVRMLVTFSAGSQADVLARLVGAKLAENSGQQVVVDNRPSAGGIVAGGIMMNASPDGHTLVMHSNAFAVSAALYTKLPYDSLKDFAAVGQVASVPYVLVVAPSLGVKSVSELIALAKQKPGQFSFGSAGTGSGTHMAGEQFKFMSGINVVHVPYKGTPEALVDTMAGRIQYWLSPLGPAMSLIKDGRLLALGVSTAKRTPVLPDVPTIAEAALAGFEFDAWFGIFAPGRTPRAIVRQINEAISRIVNVPELKERMRLQGVALKSSTPEEFSKLVSDDVATLSKVVKAAGIKVD
ncbi:MAG TPA: tripartite tricarboxylate transporter substrate binding protein [Burkholderiales bacterium]|nr:tripartite tricarboxylate transporter substrate binding protein [Burkholderiales bacterium]